MKKGHTKKQDSERRKMAPELAILLKKVTVTQKSRREIHSGEVREKDILY